MHVQQASSAPDRSRYTIALMDATSAGMVDVRKLLASAICLSAVL